MVNPDVAWYQIPNVNCDLTYLQGKYIITHKLTLVKTLLPRASEYLHFCFSDCYHKMYQCCPDNTHTCIIQRQELWAGVAHDSPTEAAVVASARQVEPLTTGHTDLYLRVLGPGHNCLLIGYTQNTHIIQENVHPVTNITQSFLDKDHYKDGICTN